jgi:hypothetical protein
MKHWKSQLKLNGYDPDLVKDATEPIEGVVIMADWKGAVIGDASACSGVRCLKRSQNAEFALVGAFIAIVCFSKTDIRRYTHNGRVPNAQDRGENPIGEVLKLIPPRPTMKLGQRNRERHQGNRPELRKPRVFKSMAARLRA